MKMVGVILAGGKSTRMKQDKALLEYKGTSLLQHQYETLESLLGKGKVIVSGDRPAFPHVKDLLCGLGPLEGLRSVCLHLLPLEMKVALLVAPVDMPFISNTGLRRLVKYKTKSDVIKFKGQQLPFVINDVAKILAVIDAIKETVSSSSGACLSFNRLFKLVHVEEIPPEKDKFFTNINTPEAWNAAIS